MSGFLFFGVELFFGEGFFGVLVVWLGVLCAPGRGIDSHFAWAQNTSPSGQRKKRAVQIAAQFVEPRGALTLSLRHTQKSPAVEMGLCWNLDDAVGSASRSREGLTQNLAKPNSSPFGPR
jgi:hypothetical protein